MIAARLPIIAVLVDPVATATAAANFCAVGAAGARMPALILCRRRSHGAVSPWFAWFTGGARPFTDFSTCRCDRAVATAVFKSP
jgi:hypothetical protein